VKINAKYDKPISGKSYSDADLEPTHESITIRKSERRTQEEWRTSNQRYSKGHIRMFRQLREEGYSWRQVATICGTPTFSPRGAVLAADRGCEYPDVTTTVLRCKRELAGEPAGRVV